MSVAFRSTHVVITAIFVANDANMANVTNVALTARAIYFEKPAPERNRLRQKICKKLGMSEDVFRSRIRGDRNWSKYEKDVFAEAFNLKTEDIQW